MKDLSLNSALTVSTVMIIHFFYYEEDIISFNDTENK